MYSSSGGRRAGMACLVLAITSLVAISARPNQGLFMDDVRRPVYRGNLRTRESKSDTTEVVVQSDINVMQEDRVMGRATVATPTLGEAVQMVTRQLLQDPTATDMVATDVRTPPRVKHRREPESEATPVVVGEASVVQEEATAVAETSSTPRSVAKVTTNGGLSTWILLSNGEQSTTVPYKKKTTATPLTQKKSNTPRPTATIEKVVKKGNESKIEKLSASMASPLVATKKPDISSTKQPLYDSKFKNRTPVIVGKLPSQKNKTESSNKKVSTTQSPVTLIDVATKKKPSGSKLTVFIPEAIPTTSLLLESSTLEAPEEPTTASGVTTTTKRTRRPSTKTKKKKNKIRPRPTKLPSSHEKIDTDLAETKIETLSRPLSTRIYNYLAREVMPNVGVGLVGLVLTAGLAGLLLYPFGGVVTRRNYDKVAPTPESNSYYYDSYNPHPGEISSVNLEDNSYAVPSNQQNSYAAPVYEGQKYNNRYRYEVQDYTNDNINGYAGIKDYSTLPDSVKGSQYSTLPENGNYYNMDPMVPLNPQYKDSDDSSYDSKYPSLTEYTAYTSASAVGTSGTYDKLGNANYDKAAMSYDTKPVVGYENPVDYDRPDIVYDKTHSYHSNTNKNKTAKLENGDAERSEINAEKLSREQPHYSALSSQPNYGNSEFVGSVSVSGSYGAELGHMTGVLPNTDLGPRSMKLSRKRRNVEDLVNEVDSILSSTTIKAEAAVKTAETPTDNKEVKNDKVNSIYRDPTENELWNEFFPAEKHDSSTIKTSEPEHKTDGSSPEGVTTVPEEEFSLINVLKRLLQVKLRVGINLLRNTSEAFQSYMVGITRRMETAVETLNQRSFPSSHVNQVRRRRRDTSKNPRHFKHT